MPKLDHLLLPTRIRRTVTGFYKIYQNLQVVLNRLQLDGQFSFIDPITCSTCSVHFLTIYPLNLMVLKNSSINGKFSFKIVSEGDLMQAKCSGERIGLTFLYSAAKNSYGNVEIEKIDTVGIFAVSFQFEAAQCSKSRLPDRFSMETARDLKLNIIEIGERKNLSNRRTEHLFTNY